MLNTIIRNSLSMAALCIAMFASRTQAAGYLTTKPVIHITIKPHSVKWHQWVAIEFTNRSTVDMYLSTVNFPKDGALYMPLLKVVSENGTEVKYCGFMVKRAAPSSEDFVRLRSGDHFDCDVDVTRSYAIDPGHAYSVSVNELYLDVRPSAGGEISPGFVDFHCDSVAIHP